MKELFWAKAAENNILPLHVPGEGSEGMPGFGKNRTRFVYNMPQSRIHEFAAPQVVGKSFKIIADIETGTGSTDGVLVAHGGHTGGYSFYIKGGYPIFYYNALEQRQYSIRSNIQLPAGTHRLEAKFTKDKEGRGGNVSLMVDGRAAGAGRVDATLWPWISYTEGFDIGADTVSPVSPDYSSGQSRFSGKIQEIVFEVNQ
jgi:arylsulfatase